MNFSIFFFFIFCKIQYTEKSKIKLILLKLNSFMIFKYYGFFALMNLIHYCGKFSEYISYIMNVDDKYFQEIFKIQTMFT
jgi:hypothetical protein